VNAQLVQFADEEVEETTTAWELTKLKPVHKQVASLLAQGMKQVDIAKLCDITPQYVGMLLKQPLVQAYIKDMCDVVGVRMEALFAQSVEVIAETMANGSEAGKLKAVRLQLEATKRIGRIDPNVGGNGSNVERLEKLAERLISLQSNVRKGGTFNEQGQEITDI
jgi:hypothetical protein